jgi:hypothetical protein
MRLFTYSTCLVSQTLTQLLSDSLDTRSTCILLACISSASAHYRATYNTLYFADRAAKSRKSEPVCSYAYQCYLYLPMLNHVRDMHPY